jgi:predicted transcriptional regulator
MVTFNEDELMHFGILRKSGRYPYGSGGDDLPTKSRTFLDVVNRHLAEGMSDSDIARAYGVDTIELRALSTVAKAQLQAANVSRALRLKEKGHGNSEAAKLMGVPESTYRSYLKPNADAKYERLVKTANVLRDEVGTNGLVDVGRGVERYMGVTREQQLAAVAMLKEDGYGVHYIMVPQVGTGKETTTKVLAAPGTTWSEVNARKGEIRIPNHTTTDLGDSWNSFKPPVVVDPKRLAISYKEDGGDKLDGVIYVRPGVPDVSLGAKNYAQVRVQVGDGHYLKGMALYKEDLPKGVDLVFNTNKSKADAPTKQDVMKPLKKGSFNPFGSVVTQQFDEKGKVSSAMNLVRVEGEWTKWNDAIASQVLSKQKPSLAKQQLAMTYERRKNQYDEIMSIPNPTLRKYLLKDFADGTDAAAVHLKAAALPRQRWHVILPIESLKETEVYAPRYDNGETVVLIRYPHGGIFEIPELKVNNKNPEARKIIGTSPIDAIGINYKVAERLSGADFDGDTVLVIPNGKKAIATSAALRDLEGFDPKTLYKKYPGMKVVSEAYQQKLMGDITNLITDMTIADPAPRSEITRAVKHSMVVIDAHKHELNYKQSYIDNGIAALKEKYQGSARSGASTLISLAKSPIRVPERVARRASEGGPIDPKTGKLVFTDTNKSYEKDGVVVEKMIKVKRLASVDDAHLLSSNTPIERVYADHSNRLKALANEARLSQLNTPRLEFSPSAAKTYAAEVASIDAKHTLALKNAVLERQSQIVAASVLKQARLENPDMDKETARKVSYQALDTARLRLGAKKNRVEFTKEEWDAIQAGAIHDSKLASILANADVDKVKALAVPKAQLLMTSTKTRRAQSMLEAGYTRAEVASHLGVSVSTLDASIE